MMPLLNPQAPCRKRGFTFVEVMIATAVLLIFAGTTLAALTQFNRYANVCRLRAHALAIAQEKLDEILTVSWQAAGTRPAVLTAGTKTENNVVINADTLNTQVALKSLYTDFAVPVTCTRMTTVTNLTTRTARAAVTVTFTYVGKTYSIALTTIRTTDTI